MFKLSDLRDKEVINIRTGTRLGLINDLIVDIKSGNVKSLVIPHQGKVLGLFGKSTEILIKWQDIQTIGDDFIIVDIDENKELLIKE